jgi:hypothetical protein
MLAPKIERTVALRPAGLRLRKTEKASYSGGGLTPAVDPETRG